MWPFKSEEVHEVAEKEQPVDYPAIEYKRMAEIKEWRDIGEEFNYLGTKCLMTHHHCFETRYRLCFPYPIPYLLKCAQIKADYVDNYGQIRSVSFGYGELGNLIKQNEPNAELAGEQRKS